jgi:4-amino-4-deoxy-L-arabinose transferase-like glycosyltransferase
MSLMQNNMSYWFNLQNFSSGNEHKFNLLWLLIFSASLILLGLGLRDPWPADEPRFAQVAREMVESGQWFFPMRGGELYPDKPPIFMWSIAIFYLLTGSLKVAFLLPSALFSLLTVYLLYDLGRRLWSEQVGWYASLLLLLTIQFTLQAKTAQIDAMVSCWITLGCYGLIRFLLLNGSWRWYFLAWFFMGLGVITKGVGFLPLLMLLPYAFVRLKKIGTAGPEIAVSWSWLLGPVMLFAAVSLWFLPMLYWVEHYNNAAYDLYRDNILLKQTVTRYSNSWHHVKPFWYYLTEVIPLFWLPISLMLPWLVLHWKAAFQAGDRRIILPLCWVVLVLIFFSLSPGKRGVYMLPALPMLALVTAPYLQHILRSKLLNGFIWSTVLLLSAVFLIFGIAGELALPFAHKLAVKYELEPWAMFMTLGAIGFLICALTFMRRRFVSWLLFIPSLWIIYSTWGYTLMDPVRTPKAIYVNIQTLIPDNAELGLIDTAEQFLLFSPYRITHWGYHTAVQPQLAAAWRWQQQASNRFVLLDSSIDTACFDFSKGKAVGLAHRVEWLLLDVGSQSAQCATNDKDTKQYDYQPKYVYGK